MFYRITARRDGKRIIELIQTRGNIRARQRSGLSLKLHCGILG